MIIPGAKACWPLAALLAPPRVICGCAPWNETVRDVDHAEPPEPPENMKVTLAGAFTEDTLKQPEMEPRAGIAGEANIEAICAE
jgi:hypothetical protein